jgi:hypothetical protein
MNSSADATLPGHDLSHGELLYGHLLRDGSRWVRIGCTYGYPGPIIYTVRAIYGGVTYYDENFHAAEYVPGRDPYRGKCRVQRSGPGRWDGQEFDMDTYAILTTLEPFRSRSQRRYVRSA